MSNECSCHWSQCEHDKDPYYVRLGRLSMAKRTPAERSRFARIGSLTAARNGTQHRWTSETAQIAGRKGGRPRGGK